MFLRPTSRLLHCALGASLSLLLLLLLTPCCHAQYQMVVPSGPVLAMLGGEAVLSCQLEPADDVSEVTVEWARPDLASRFVVLRRDGVELLYQQNPLYVGRTDLSVSRLKHGDLSLRLSDVKLSDEGTHKCHVPGKASAEVQLQVGSASPTLAISAEADESSGGVALGCRSVGWYPEPELLWLDSEGKPVPAGPPQTLQGPDGLYSVSSRVTVEKEAGNTFSCRVQQSNISQSTTAQLSFRVEDLQDASCPAARILIVLFSAVGVVIWSFIVSWKLKVNTRSDEERKTEEEEELFKLNTGLEGEVLKLTEELKKKEEEEKKNLEGVIEEMKKKEEEEKKNLEGVIEEMKKKEEEEKKNLEGVIDQLMKWKKEEEESRRKLEVRLREVEQEIREKEKKLQGFEKLFTVHKDYKKEPLLIDKAELQLEKTRLEKFVSQSDLKLQNFEEMIRTITKQKQEAGTKIQKIKEQMETGRQEDDRKKGRSQTEETAESANTENPPGPTCETETKPKSPTAEPPQ